MTRPSNERGVSEPLTSEESGERIKTMLGELLSYERHGKPQDLTEWASAISSLRGGREEALKEAENAVREAVAQFCRSDAFVMSGPAGIGIAAIAAIRALASPSREGE